MAVLPNQACCNLIVNKMFKHSIKFYKQKDAMQCGVAYSIKAGIEVLLENVSPCILHWNQNHFVVLYKTNKRGTKFWIADPSKGKYRLSLDECKKN